MVRVKKKQPKTKCNTKCNCVDGCDGCGRLHCVGLYGCTMVWCKLQHSLVGLNRVVGYGVPCLFTLDWVPLIDVTQAKSARASSVASSGCLLYSRAAMEDLCTAYSCRALVGLTWSCIGVNMPPGNVTAAFLCCCTVNSPPRPSCSFQLPCNERKVFDNTISAHIADIRRVQGSIRQQHSPDPSVMRVMHHFSSQSHALSMMRRSDADLEKLRLQELKNGRLAVSSSCNMGSTRTRVQR